MGRAETQIHVTWALATAMASILTSTSRGEKTEKIASDVADYIAARYGGEDLETIFTVLERLPIHVAERIRKRWGR
jgi:hypothetical protein